MNDFLKYLSTAPVLMTAWLSITTTFILAMNFIYPDALTFPAF
jgi:type II secretory pathway component PulL